MLGILGLLVGIGSFMPKVHAEGAEFTITPQFGAGQTDSSVGYFSIKADDDQTYPLTVNVQNLSTKTEHTFTAKLVAASTTNSGSIDYTPNNQLMTKSKAPLLPDLAATKSDRKQTFTLEPGASKDITFNVKVPKKGFKGTILGSVYVKRASSETTQKSGVGINNQFAMTMPVILAQNFDQKVKPKLSLTMAKMKSGTGAPQVVGRIENSAPTMFGQIKMHAWLTKQGQTKKLYQKSATKLAMAPRSTFEYAIDTNNKLLPAGKYTYYVKMKSGEKTFNLKHNFTVDQATRQNVNKSMINPDKSINWWIWGPVAVLIILAIALLAYFIGKKRSAGDHEA